jgi:ribosome silencing factor RsfS/YbeB/iojap
MLPSVEAAPESPPKLHQELQEKSLNHMTTRTRPRRSAERVSPLQETVTAALDDMKAVNVKVLDVRGLTDIADTMVIASGNSDRHVRSIADNVARKAKEAGFRPLGTEGARDGEWVLVDLTDILVHVMLPRVREFYGLERLWDQGETAGPDTKPGPKAVPDAPDSPPSPPKAKTRSSRSPGRRPAARRQRPAT